MKLANIYLVILITLFLFLRLYQLPQVMNFSADQGTTLLRVYKLWQEGKLSLIGPESSIKTTGGRSFFHGPWIDYFLLPVMLATNWNPLAGSYLFIFLNLIALIILFKAVQEKFNLQVAFLTCFLFSFNLKMVRFSQFFWNPNFLPLVSSIIIFLLIKILKKPSLCLFFLIGLTLGFGLGCHYQVVLLIIGVILFLVFKKTSFKSLLTLIMGVLVGFSPLIIFELKHNFYNLRTVFLILKQGSQNPFRFPLSFYRFLSFMPFLFLTAAILLEKIIKKSRLAGLGIILIYAVYSLGQIVPQPTSGFTMPKGWNYLGVKKTAQIILKENRQDYNVASLLSGDTRAYPIRYMLTIKNKPPLAVEQYPKANYLFVVSQHSKEKTINNPVWEISSFCPCSLIKTWPIQNNINLYLLRKNAF